MAMATAELLRALGNVDGVLVEANAVEVLRPLGLHSNAPRPSAEALLRCFATLSTAQGRFGEAETALVQAMELQPLFANLWWANLVIAFTWPALPDSLATEIAELCLRLRMMTRDLPKVAALLQPEPAAAADGVVVMLPGLNGQPAGLGRVAAVLDGVDLLATALGELDGVPVSLCLARSELAGGAATNLAFDGEPAPMLRLRHLLGMIGDQIDAHPTMAPDNRGTVIAPSLPIMDQIAGRPDAARLRSLIDAGVRRLLEAGCVLPASDPMDAPPADQLRPPEPPPPSVELRDVIAEERRQLARSAQRPAQSQSRMWPGTPRTATAH